MFETTARISVYCNHASNERTAQRPVFLILMCLFGLAVLLTAAGCGIPPAASEEQPVEPHVAERDTFETGYSLLGRFSVVNPEMTVYSLEISESGQEILFSSEAGTVSLLDEEGGLQWEVDFDSPPTCARLSSDGRVAIVGTEDGVIHYLLSGGRVLWEQDMEGSFRNLTLSPEGEYIAASLSEANNNNAEDKAPHTVYLFDRWGRKLWEKETGAVQDLFFSPKGELYVLEKTEEGDTHNLFAIEIRTGEALSWNKQVYLASFSESGNYIAFYGERTEGEDNGEEIIEDLTFYRLREGREPKRLWEQSLEIEVGWLDLTEDGDKVIAYSEFSGGFDNLVAFDGEGEFLWSKRIPGGALVQTSPAGDKIVASSWQEYSEDFSKVLVKDTSGKMLQEFEMATRIEKMALSGWGNILALAGSDGNIFVLDVGRPDPEQVDMLAEEEKEINYNPVSFELPEDSLYLTLFFYDEVAEELVPINRSIGRTSGVLQAAIDELVRGPRRVSGLYRTIPKDANIDVKLEDGKTYLDLPEELDQLSGPSQLQGIVDSLVLTASQFTSVNGISFMVKGEEIEALGDKLMLDETYAPERPLNERPLLFVPHRSQGSLFLLPDPLEADNDSPQTPSQFVDLLLDKGEGYFPLIPEVKDARVRRDEIIIDWDSSIKELFPAEEVTGNDKALAYIFSDMFLLTLSANFPPDRVVFQVEGEEWDPPEIYPSFERRLQQPFFINPE